MKILLSVTALSIALAWPGDGEAQSKKPKVKAKSATTSQQYVRHARSRGTAARPCAARSWSGCQGWDPDPQVRSMIRLDAGRDDEP
jgi:hypothetical protein